MKRSKTNIIEFEPLALIQGPVGIGQVQKPTQEHKN